MRMAQIRDSHGKSPIQKATHKQMFANRNDNNIKPYSYTKDEKADPLSHSFNRNKNLDNIQINQDLNDYRRGTLDNRSKPDTFEQPQKYRLNKPDFDSGQPLR